MYTYLLLDIFTILFPLLFSFHPKIAYYKKWKYLFPAIFITGAFFIVWDILFTHKGIWSFNPLYLTGINIINLPIEEWLFFIVVPFSSVFIYDILKIKIYNPVLNKLAKIITVLLMLVLFILAFLNINRMYTFYTFVFTGIFLLLHLTIFKSHYLGKFYVAYIIHLIPFFIINGFLTALPVVIYDNTENLSIRMFTIPVEDSIYALLLLLMNVTFFEELQARRNKKATIVL